MAKIKQKRCPECGGWMKMVVVKRAEPIKNKNQWQRGIYRYECPDKNCKHTETPFNNDRELNVAYGTHDQEIGIITDEQNELNIKYLK